MPDPNADEFERLFHHATFSDQEVLASTGAGTSVVGGMTPKIIVSVQCRRFGPPNALALAFATRDGHRVGPFLLTPKVAGEIRRVLQEAGF